MAYQNFKLLNSKPSKLLQQCFGELYLSKTNYTKCHIKGVFIEKDTENSEKLF